MSLDSLAKNGKPHRRLGEMAFSWAAPLGTNADIPPWITSRGLQFSGAADNHNIRDFSARVLATRMAHFSISLSFPPTCLR